MLFIFLFLQNLPDMDELIHDAEPCSCPRRVAYMLSTWNFLSGLFTLLSSTWRLFQEKSQWLYPMQVTTCPDCSGTGSRGEPCSSCGGDGRVRRSKKISLRVPPGVDNGSRLRVKGEGNAGLRGGQGATSTSSSPSRSTPACGGRASPSTRTLMSPTSMPSLVGFPVVFCSLPLACFSLHNHAIFLFQCQLFNFIRTHTEPDYSSSSCHL